MIAGRSADTVYHPPQAKKGGPTQGPLNIAGRCPLREVKRGPREVWPGAIIDGQPSRQTERMTGQGRTAAPAGWRGPQRSEDTGRTGRTLDAAGVAQRSRHGRGDVGRRP